jgi:predicted amidohydrolase
VVGDLESNRATVAAAIEAAGRAGAALAVVPELSDSGYVFAGREEALRLAEPAASSATLAQWASLAARFHLSVVGGFVEEERGVLYNSAAVVDPSGVRAIYRKAHLWDREKLVFEQGEGGPAVVETAAGRLGVMICYDIEFPEWVRQAALAGADVLAVPTNMPLLTDPPPGERPVEVAKAQAAAAVNGVYVVVSDRCGAERGVRFMGASSIIGPDGYPLAGPVLADRPAVLTADIDLSRARDKRTGERNDLFADRRPALYGSCSAEEVRAPG